MKKSVKYPVVLAVIAALCVAGIDVIYSAVAEKIEQAKKEKELNAVSVIFKNLQSDKIEAEQAEYNGEEIAYYRCRTGYAVVTKAQGYDGAVKVMTGWDESLENIVGIYVLGHTETPGLGGNVDLVNSSNTWWNVITFSMKDESDKRPDFQEQFRNLTLAEAKLKKDSGKIDALTGATITSNAVVRAVQKSHKVLSAVLNKGAK